MTRIQWAALFIILIMAVSGIAAFVVMMAWLYLKIY